MNQRPTQILTAVFLFMCLAAALPDVQAQQIIWADDFDTYPTGENLHGVGGWKGWSNDPTFTAFTTDVQARSAPNSVDIVSNSDLVHEYSITAGVFHYRFYQYIPSNFQGQSYFIMHNQYDDSVATTNWSLQIFFDSSTGLIVDTGASGATTPFVPNQWIQNCIEIDLDADTQNYYYDGHLFYDGSWSNHVSGGGLTSIASANLFANGASSIYYDDMVLASGSCRMRGVRYFLHLPFVQG